MEDPPRSSSICSALVFIIFLGLRPRQGPPRTMFQVFLKYVICSARSAHFRARRPYKARGPDASGAHPVSGRVMSLAYRGHCLLPLLLCLINSVRFLGFLLWFVSGPGGLREALEGPRRALGGPSGPPGGPQSPGARANKQYLLAICGRNRRKP